ncbi:gp4 head completion protein [Aeromonas phage 65]|uniref:Head completion nuclease n=2 Tax=Ishigurovirus osborne TaxID=260149 RepID=A0A219YBW6_9CAUD|nr:head closure [Aeromonas phage 65]ADQ53122.1 gp4 head completion protein [Aeromonas phage 65]APU01501.1 head completion protein [Aeromonas phage 65.2]
MAGHKAHKGQYFVKNPEKYKGDHRKVTYRSSWEKYIMELLDNHPDVKYWNSEELVIPYFSNADGKKRRYFMDMYIQWIDGSVSLWEVKPTHECYPPVPPKRNTLKAKNAYIHAQYTWAVNNDKWKTTVALCEKKGWKFNIITEIALKKMGFKGLKK